MAGAGGCCMPGGKRCTCPEQEEPAFARIATGGTDGMVRCARDLS